MESNLPLLYEFFILSLLVVANGFFVAVEFSLVRSHPTKLRERGSQDNYGSASATKLIDDLDFNLSATQLGITVASLLLGARSHSSLQPYFLRWFEPLGERVAVIASQGTATLAALLVVTFMHVVFGELIAKSIAIRHPETTLRMLAAPMLVFSKLCRAPIWFFNKIANFFLSLVGIRGMAAAERVHTLSELAMMVSHSSESGILDKDEESMLKGVFGFSDTVAREVMTPRTDLVCLSEKESAHRSSAHPRRYQDLIQKMGRESRFQIIPTRCPPNICDAIHSQRRTVESAAGRWALV